MLFISPSELFTFSRYLSFCHDFLVIYKNGLIRKIRLISKFMKQLNAIHILPNISRSKGVQKMKFGALIEHNMRNIFFWKCHTQNLVEKLFPDSFLKNQIWLYLWIISLKIYIICYYCMLIWGLLKYSKTKLQTNCFYLI